MLQSGQVNTDRKGLALEGYDPVSYFSGSPVLGSSENMVEIESAIYYFKSEENREKFKLNPQKYTPQYGGWCAYAMGLGPQKVKINPVSYKILEGKLYLFYDFKGNNTLLPWNKDEASLKNAADLNWGEITK